MKLMMSMTSGGCFLTVLALGYAQDNPLSTTLMRAVIAMLIGLILSRWWGLMVRKELAFNFLDDLKQKETALSEEENGQDEANQLTEDKVATE